MSAHLTTGFYVISIIAASICLIAIIVTLLCCIAVKPKKFRLSALITGIVFGVILIGGGAITAVNFSLKYGWAVPDRFEYQTYYIEDTEIISLNIDCHFVNLEVRDNTSLSYTIPTNFDITAEVDKGELRIRQTGHNYFNWDAKYAPTITLYIPSDMSLRYIICATDAGTITAKNLTSGSASFLSALGAITIENINVSSALSVSADMGAISVSNCRSESGELTVYNSMGETVLEDLSFSYIKASCDMGDMQLNYIEAKNIELNVDMGSLSGEIIGQKSEYTISVDCDFGESNLWDQTGTTDKTLSIEVNMGSIEVQFVSPKHF